MPYWDHKKEAQKLRLLLFVTHIPTPQSLRDSPGGARGRIPPLLVASLRVSWLFRPHFGAA